MTKEAIKYVIETQLGEALDKMTPLNSVKVIRIDTYGDKYPRINGMRFKFNTADEVLECVVCRKFVGEIPSNWVLYKNYDIYNGTTYKYLFDTDTMEPFVDVYDFSRIAIIETKEG